MVESTRPRRAAARLAAKSASEDAGAIALQVGEQLSLLFPGNSLAADRARISNYAALREAVALLDSYLAGCSAFDDWVAACLVLDDGAVFDQDAAFASFWHFCNLIELPSADRVPHREFANCLGTAGFPQGRSPEGRAFHTGARLVDKFGGAVRLAGVMPVGMFIAECCALGPDFRSKAGEMHEAYAEFSRSRGADPLGSIHFSKALLSLGFRRLHSDGHIYCGVKLAKPAGSKGRRAR